MPMQAQFRNPNHGMSVEEQMKQNVRKTYVNDILRYAYSFKGVPYRYGHRSPSGFDCSGFTSYVFANFGIHLDRTSRDQIHNGKRVDRKDLRAGDLVFFARRGGGPGIGHVGIVTEVDDDGSGNFHFIHAATRTGITESHSSETYYKTRYRGACRVID